MACAMVAFWESVKLDRLRTDPTSCVILLRFNVLLWVRGGLGDSWVGNRSKGRFDFHWCIFLGILISWSVGSAPLLSIDSSRRTSFNGVRHFPNFWLLASWVKVSVSKYARNLRHGDSRHGRWLCSASVPRSDYMRWESDCSLQYSL